jgi:branched-chain amino acid transport system permease protein
VRIRGVQLAVVTISAAVLLQTQFFENEAWTGLRAGSNAIVKDPTFFGIDLSSQNKKSGLTDNPNFTIFCVVVLCLMCGAVCNLRRSGTGRRFLAVRANERAAAAAGIEVPRTKLLAFGIASAIAAVGGLMTGFQQRQVSSANWVFFASLAALAFCYLGGITSVAGAVIGGVLGAGGLVAVIGDYHNKGFTQYLALVGGLGMILTAVIHPEGQAPFWQPAVRYLGTWLKTAPLSAKLRAVKRVVPGMIPGFALTMWIVGAKATEFRNWHLLLASMYGLMGRGIGMRLWGAFRKKDGGGGGNGHGPVPAASATKTEKELAGA